MDAFSREYWQDRESYEDELWSWVERKCPVTTDNGPRAADNAISGIGQPDNASDGSAFVLDGRSHD